VTMEANADDNPQSALKTVRKNHIIHLIRVQGNPKTNTPKFGEVMLPLSFDSGITRECGGPPQVKPSREG